MMAFMKTLSPIMAALLLLAAKCAADDSVKMPAHGKAEHVVLVVWDGMRPDFATEQYAPTLCKLLKSGVFLQTTTRHT